MRKIIVSEMVSLDGYFAGLNGETNWHNVDAEFNDAYAIPMLGTADVLLFGRVTNDVMASYWPTERAIKDDPIVAAKMDSLPKVVFSKTVRESAWGNTTFVPEITAEDIHRLKQLGDGNILVFGSGTVVQTLTDLGLIDEYRIIVNPLILGNGKSLFKGAQPRKLKLLRTQEFKSGNVLLCYGL